MQSQLSQGFWWLLSFYIYIHTRLSYWAFGDHRAGVLGGRAGGRSYPLLLVWIGRDTVEREITIRNLFYCTNFSYCCWATWRWTVWGGCLRKCAWHQWEQLWAHEGRGTDASGSTTLFRCELHMVCERIETAGVDNIRARTSSGCIDGRA
jgi:hypothetical protein